MDIYRPVDVADVDVHNAIQTLGCNILLCAGVSTFNYYNLGKARGVREHIKKFKKQLISKVLSKDGDYGQIAIMNFGNGAYTDAVEEALKDVFDVMFVSKIKGGHGNLPCTLVILDLSKLREEAGIVPVDPDGEDDDDEDNDVDDDDQV